MSGYNYKEFAKEFAKRAEKNYQNIYSQYKENEKEPQVYEVNALITELFAVVVVPLEMYKDRFKSPYHNSNKKFTEFTINLKERKANAFGILRNLLKKLEKENRLKSTYYYDYYKNYKSGSEEFEPLRFIYHLRNALSHSGKNGLQFIPSADPNNKAIKDIHESDKNYITDVYFYDVDEKYGKGEFCVKLTIEEVAKVKDMILDIIDYQGFYEDDSRELKNQINSYNKFLNS